MPHYVDSLILVMSEWCHIININSYLKHIIMISSCFLCSFNITWTTSCQSSTQKITTANFGNSRGLGRSPSILEFTRSCVELWRALWSQGQPGITPGGRWAVPRWGCSPVVRMAATPLLKVIGMFRTMLLILFDLSCCNMYCVLLFFLFCFFSFLIPVLFVTILLVVVGVVAASAAASVFCVCKAKPQRCLSTLQGCNGSTYHIP